MATRNAKATWRGTLKEGEGTMGLGSGVWEGPFTFKSRFEAAFKERFGRTPDPYALLGYRAMQRVFQAIENAGSRAHLRSVVGERYFQLEPVSHAFRLISSPASRRR